MARSTFVYVTYIRTTRERLWSALTDDVEFMKQYWFGVHCESQWTAGSSWKIVSSDGQIFDAGEIVAAEPPRRPVIRRQHQNKPELKAEGDSLCTIELEPTATAVKLSITHTIEREPSQLIAAVSGGWPKVISNLKSLLESGSIALQDPYPAAIPTAAADTPLRGDCYDENSRLSRRADGANHRRQHDGAIGSDARSGREHRPRSRRTHRWLELAGRL
jgi:uncharacterized protein YndB with AHSA1/START domain